MSTSAPAPSPDMLAQFLRGETRTPHHVLGPHAVVVDGVSGVQVRALVPHATGMDVVVEGHAYPMHLEYGVLFSCFLPDVSPSVRYRLRVHRADGTTYELDDPYRFAPTLGDIDLHLFGEGRHLRLWEKLGAHPCDMDGVAGTAFAVWAPNAVRVSVIGSFNGWDGRAHPMRVLGNSGVFELFIPGVGAEALYKYEIRALSGLIRVKTDPMAAMMEQSPGHASIVVGPGRHVWNDGSWLSRRRDGDPVHEPMLVYEVHLASWMRGEENRLLTYRELAPKLAAHVARLGFTHVELLPVQEHPFGGSWGYQVGGYYAPTSRHGTPDDFRFFVDTLHEAGIGVLLDWVPAHFPKDDWALRRFDGTPCYEHADSRLGDHPEWGTHIFNYARHEVRNFLLANALYWIEEFHIDGLRVDAVASMLYLDYGREAGQWLRNKYGGRENLDAVSFVKQLNHSVSSLHPGVIMVAEESTTWPRVTHPIGDGGLGFTFKWNMGWMHDTLDYFRVDPFFRKGSHDKLTFAMMYEYSERFVNPLSHDEVVHLKKSLLDKMPGDSWQRFANLRALIAYSVTRPGKSLFFMGTELAPHREWNHDASLDWQLSQDPRRHGVDAFMQALGAQYRAHSCFWSRDDESDGFAWINVADKENSVLAYARMDGAAHAVTVLNLTPVAREQYRLGAPTAGRYACVLNSDDVSFGGSGYPMTATWETEDHPYHGFPQSIVLTLPPLSALVLLPEPMPTGGSRQVNVSEEVTLVVDSATTESERADGPAREKKSKRTARPSKSEKPTKARKAKKPTKAEKPTKSAKPKPEKPKPEKPTKSSKPAKPKKAEKALKPIGTNSTDSVAKAKARARAARPSTPARRTKPPAADGGS